MPLLEFHCRKCGKDFEQITKQDDPDRGRCPDCRTQETDRLFSSFKVAGRGDLRESTMHGCHGCHNPGHKH